MECNTGCNITSSTCCQLSIEVKVDHAFFHAVFLEQMLLCLSLSFSFLLWMYSPLFFFFSGRGMELSFLLFSAMLPLLSVSAYNTSAGNDCAVSHTNVCFSHRVPSCLHKTIVAAMNALWACCLLVWFVFVFGCLLVNVWWMYTCWYVEGLYDNKMSPDVYPSVILLLIFCTVLKRANNIYSIQ